ncbi:unnamed protein product [Strongylus vulgaris]|uniref:Vps52 C-terminal domain-containing protein n=1 Tax=Strongylus vulgaris TaxID=40348 RepID=A0A3P7JRZ3_STRVU|nr:unnamed protein product [Strongylus vulgaris]
MQMHNDSVKALDVRRMQTPIDTRPHYIVRRYAELTCAFLVVTESSGREVGQKMEAILESCEDAVEQLLLRMSATLPSPRDRLVFLINNYDLTLSIIDVNKLTAVVQSFSANWRRSIDAINGEVVKSFTNFKNGTNILQAVFTQLVQYVQRFTKLVSHEIFRDNPARNDMVNIHHILVELKKYKPVY